MTTIVTSSPPMSPITRRRKASLLTQPDPKESQIEINPFDIESNNINKQLNSHEKYDFYIENSIPESEIDASTEQILINAYKLVPQELLENRFLLKHKQNFESEFKRNHLTSVRKSILNYILLDTEEQKRLDIRVDPIEESLVCGRGPVPWHAACEEAKTVIGKKLWHLNPMMTKIKVIYDGFKESVKFDFKFIEASSHIGLEEFSSGVKDQIAKIKESIKTVYGFK